MIRLTSLITFFMLLTASAACSSNNNFTDPVHENYSVENADYSVLVFTKTSGFRHDSIEQGVEAVVALGAANGFSVTRTENSDYFTDENLSSYSAIIFLNTTLTVFDENHRVAFKQYIQNGGGFVGVHSASDTEYDWPWYGELVGAYFDNHPPGIHDAIIDVINTDHPSTAHLPGRWEKADEWYNFGYINDEVEVLMKLDTDSYEGSDHPGNHPVAWYHEYDGGRAFYTALGHTRESYSEPLFIDHLLGGILYASGQ